MYRVNPQSEWRNFVSEKFESMKKVKNFLVLEIVSYLTTFRVGRVWLAILGNFAKMEVRLSKNMVYVSIEWIKVG